MKKTFLLVIALFSLFTSSAQIVITEIMYNPPEAGTDTTEFLELYNISNDDINLNGYQFIEGIEFTFGAVTINSGEHLVITKNNAAFQAYYGFEAIEWTDGSLSNSGEDIILVNAVGEEVDLVDYDNENNWVTEPDGSGYSLELCDPFKDNNDPENWVPSATPTQAVVEGLPIFASPGQENEVDCPSQIDYTIEVLGLQFDPKNLIIELNETVQWVNNSGGYHNVNGSLAAYPENPEGFYSGGPSNDNWVFTHTFTLPGVYEYRCDQHVAFGMIGTIEVLPEEAGKLVITEIMYNDPGPNDSLEYVEIYNYGTKTINLNNYKLVSKEVDFTFPDIQLNPGEYLVISRNSERFSQYFGFETISWGDPLLNNNQDKVQILDGFGNVVDVVDFDDNLPWPSLPDGYGHSLNLCRPELDNSMGENWQAAPNSAGTEVDGYEIFANPGGPSYCQYEVAEISMVDEENGELVYDDLSVEITGTVHGVNLRPGAIQVTLIDAFNDGIALYSSASDFGYQVNEGDKIIALGKTGQYNGLAQIYLDTVLFFGQQLPLSTPEVVTELNEATESQLVTIENVMLVNPGNWGTGTSGFNVEVTDGNNDYVVRIDNDVDIFSENYPTGTFSVTGIGGQFDNTSPYFEGYQLLPRYIEDIDPFVPNQIPEYTIGEITGNDENGKADSVGITCYIEGVVYGTNFGNGLSFTLIDDNNDGINIYSGGNNTGYEVQEGDRLKIKGTVKQYNGLTEFEPNEIEVLSTNNDLFDPLDVVELNESTESQLVKIAFLSLVDEAEWKGNGSSFNVTVTNGSNEFIIRIDNDCELSEMAAPEGLFHATGIGGQYDTSEPYTSGYQLFPRYAADIDIADNSNNLSAPVDIRLFPNPVSDALHFTSTQLVHRIEVYDLLGNKLLTAVQGSKKQIDLDILRPGVYAIVISGPWGSDVKRIIKQD